MDLQAEFRYLSNELFGSYMAPVVHVRSNYGPKNLSMLPKNVRARQMSQERKQLQQGGVFRSRGRPRGPTDASLELRNRRYAEKKKLSLPWQSL